MNTILLRILITPLIMSILCCTALIADEMYTDKTGRFGGSGGKAESKACKAGERMTGMSVLYGDVIDKILIQCHKIDALGKWSGALKTSSYTRSDLPNVGRKNKHLKCPKDTYVNGLDAKISNRKYGGVYVLSEIKLYCKAYQLPHEPLTSSQTNPTLLVTADGGNYHSSPRGKIHCNGQAYKMDVKRGFHVDSIQLSCKKGRPGWKRADANVNFSTPQIISPTSNGMPVNLSADFKFQKASNASKYFLTIRPSGQSNQTIYERLHTITQATGRIRVSIPSQYQSKSLIWTLRACNSAKCGPQSSTSFKVFTRPPRLDKPSHNSNLYTRKVKFEWTPQGSSDHQLYIWKSNQTTPQPNATSQTGRVYSVKTKTGINNTGLYDRTITIPAELGSNLKWSLSSCKNYSSVGRQCGPLATPKTLKVMSATVRKTR